jgi:serine/threonine protein kinase
MASNIHNSINNNSINNNSINKQNKKSKLISEGAYGCVYYPSVNCKGKLNVKDNNISKLQIKNFYSDNEIKVSNIIKTINNYSLYFIPIIKHCPVNLKTLKNSVSLSECSIIEDVDMDKSKNKYVLMESLFISNVSFYSILTNSSYSKKHILLKLIETYEHLLDGLELLGQKKIVHNDLKGDNILYNIYSSVPQIIDFGISIPFELLNNENIKDYFYIYAPEYNAWSLDYDVICYILHEMPVEGKFDFNESIVEKISNDYVNNQKFLKLFNTDFKKTYLNNIIKYYNSFVGKTKNTIINQLLKHYKTWDNYALSILYLNIFSYIFDETIINKNKLINYFIKILVKNISPDPNERYNIEESKRLFKNIFYLEENVDKYIDFTNNFDYDNDELTQTLKDDIKVATKIKSKIIK